VLGRAGLTATRHGRPLRRPGDRANDGSLVPEVADVHALNLEEGRRLPTTAAGLFLFLPVILDLGLPGAVTLAGLPGSVPIPPLPALPARLAPKLLGTRPSYACSASKSATDFFESR